MIPAKPTKFTALMQSIKTQIENGQLLPGDKLPTETEICDLYGVSRQTVRQAIKLLQEKNLVASKRGSGTYVCDSTKSVTPLTKSVGVISPYLDDYIFPRMIRGIESVLSQNGYTMQIGITNNTLCNENRMLRSMIDQNPQGILIEPAKSALPRVNFDLYDEIKSKNIPCIMMNGIIPSLDFPMISLQDEISGQIATDYLISQGHSKIGACCKLDDYAGHMRYKGFLRSLMTHGLEETEEHTMWYDTQDIETMFSGAADSYVLSRYKNCTAIVCFNDLIALKLLELFKRNNISVPNDISIIGHDDSILCTLVQPKLTSIIHPIEYLGQLAANNLIQMINNPSFEATVGIPPQLVIRDSVRSLL